MFDEPRRGPLHAHEALQAHESQTGGMEQLDEFVRAWAARNAAAAGLPEGRLAEAFMVVNTG